MQNNVRLKQHVRGTRILYDEDATKLQDLINTLSAMAEQEGFRPIMLPSLEPLEVYREKIGGAVERQLYMFKDKKGRDLCLRPEGTATCQILARGYFKNQKSVRLYYVTRCWRYERPQAGRFREFTQFGAEILNPDKDYGVDIVKLASYMVSEVMNNYTIRYGAKRGLSYYLDNQGFEIECSILGAQKQVVGGGPYKEGIGFAIGVERLLLATELEQEEADAHLEELLAAAEAEGK